MTFCPRILSKIDSKQNDKILQLYENCAENFANLVGNPALNIPCGFSKKDLPIGLQIISNSFNEETLFNFAHSLKEGNIFD